jgi:hypothetical protein
MFENKKLVRHTDAGTQRVHGCKIQRGNYDWVVSCKGRTVGNADTYCEAEALAASHDAAMDAVEYATSEQQAEQQAEACAEARYAGATVRGFDENGNVEVW